MGERWNGAERIDVNINGIDSKRNIGSIDVASEISQCNDSRFYCFVEFVLLILTQHDECLKSISSILPL